MDLFQMFRDATNVGTATNSSWDTWNTSKVTTMSGMFRAANKFNQNIGSWNTSKVTNMQEVFRNASTFNQDISRKANSVSTYTPAAGFQNTPTSDDAWYTGSVTNMTGMFQGSSSSNRNTFNQNISNWCVSQFTFMPTDFDTNTLTGWSASSKPNWGNCPTAP
jgi:surface protein